MGMGFEVVEAPGKPIWVPVNSTSTLYVGQCVYYNGASDTPGQTGGVSAMVAASGHADGNTVAIPFGVIVGTSDTADAESYTTLTTAAIQVKQITGVDSAAAQLARQNRMVEGMYAKGDQQAFVQVVRITPQTVLRGYFRASATVGTTALTNLACTGTPTTTQVITATFGFTPVADNATMFCTSGANAGLYRVRTDTSATTAAFTRAWPVAATAGDKFKCVNVRQGYCRMQFDTTYGLWIDNTAAMTSHWYSVLVYEIDLSKDAGDECCTFSFSAAHFLPYQSSGHGTTT
jgi:hypothetical protein